MTDIEYIEAFFASYPFLSLMVAGVLGTMANWFKRYCKNETKLGFFEYGKVHARAIMGSLVVLTSVIFPMVTADALTANFQTIATFYLAGYKLNSIFTPTDELVQGRKHPDC